MGLTQITTGGVDDNINIDSNTLKVDGTNNRVGIGTASPGDKLAVSDGSNITELSGYSLYFKSDSTGYIQAGPSGGSSGRLVFQTNATERMRIDSSGNVGIGLTSPTEFVDIRKDQNAFTWAQIQNQDSSSGAYAGIQFGANGNTWGLANGSSAANSNSLVFVLDAGGSNSEKMRIDSSGRLLINHTADTAPQGYESKLQLCDKSYQGSSLLLRRDGGTSGPALLFAKSRGTTQGAHTAVQVNDNIGTLRVFAADGTDTNSEPVQIRAQMDDTPGSNDTPGRLIFSTATDGSATATEKMRLNSKGQLWITEGHTPADINDEIRLALRGSQPKLQIQGVGSGYTEGAVLCHAPTSSRGGGIYMHNDNNGGTHIEWFAGRPYSASDFFVVSRRSGSPDIGGSTAQNSYRLLRVDNAGNLLIQGTLTQSGSDNKLKTNRTRLTSALQKVESLEGFTFNWNQDAIDNYGFSADDGTLVGMSAQELQAVLPEAVHTLTKENEVDDPTSGEDAGTLEYLTIQYERVVPLLVEAIKELSTNNNALQARIAALEAAE